MLFQKRGMFFCPVNMTKAVTKNRMAAKLQNPSFIAENSTYSELTSVKGRFRENQFTTKFMFSMKSTLQNAYSMLFQNLSNKKALVALIAIAVFSLQDIQAQDGEKLFKQNCAACHSIGKGKLVGPDLHGVTELRNEQWLIKWIKGSQAMVNSGDPEAKAIFEEFNKIPMPDQNLPDADIKGILAFIKDKSAQVPAASETAGAPVGNKSDNATTAEITAGQHLFEGGKRLTNGGPACVSCHNVTNNKVIPGGLLAKDLTNVHSRLGGDAGIMGILNAPPFPAMTEAYNGKPITETEIADLTAFLNKADKESATQKATASPLLKWGFLGFAIWVGIVLLLWRKKKWNMVKQRIFDRQVKTR